MNINIKNCNVKIIGGTNSVEIEKAEEPDGIITTQRLWTLKGFLANKDKVTAGDTVRLNCFTVPRYTITGTGTIDSKTMTFNKMKFTDDADVINVTGNEIMLRFRHCLFQSAVDFTGETDFARTQLGLYLDNVFKTAMNEAGIPAKKCGLVSFEEVFGDDMLPFFEDRRNRVGSDLKDEGLDCYWLETTGSVGCFCYSDGGGFEFLHPDSYGFKSCYSSDDSEVFVRPKFTVQKKEN